MRKLPLLERDSEQRLLADAVADCAVRGGQIVILRGPAGSGKTALLDWLCEFAGQRGVRVLRARGADFERDFPFGTIRQLLQPLLAEASRDERARIFAGSAALARPLFGPRGPSIDDREDRGAAFIEGIAWTVSNLARELDSCVVLAIDDVHACDRASLRALVRIALRLDEVPVLLVVAARPMEPGAEEDLLAWLSADPDAMLLDLAPLSIAAVAELLARQLGTRPAPGFTQACAEVTGGNPFLTRELALALAADGVQPDEAGSQAVRRMVPDTVLRSVGARMVRLGKRARMLADAVAVLGSESPLRHAAEVAGLEHSDAAAAADDLISAGLLADGEPLRFTHPLVASAVERDIGALAARHAHVRAARVLAADGEPAERVAAHLLSSPPGRDRWTVDVLRSVAAERVRNGGARGAVPLLRRALDEPPPPEEREPLLQELAFAEAAAGEPTATGRLLDLLGVVVDLEERVRALRELARLQFLNEHHREAALTIKQAMSELGDDHPLAAGLLGEFLAYAGVGSSTLDAALREQAVLHVTELLARLEQGTLPDDPALLIHVANALGAGRGPRLEVRRLITKAMAHGPLENLPPYGIASSWAVLALACVDELDLAGGIAEHSELVARQSGSMHGSGLAAFSRAVIAVERGTLDVAVNDANTALDLAVSGVPTTLVWSAALLSTAHRLTGDLDAAQRSIAVAERTAEDDIAYGIGIEARAHLQLALGRPAHAWNDAHTAAAALDKFMLRDYPLFPWRLAAARAGAQLGRLPQAVEYVEEELALARTSGAARSIGRALVLRAELSEDRDAELELLEEAALVLAESPARFVRAQALYRLGASRRRLGLADAAKGSLLSALQLAETCAAAPLVNAIRGELRQLGVRPRAGSRSGWAALTPAERRVAMLAADGRTNRQIAAELHLAISTVEYHLTRAFRKLGISARSQLGNMAGELRPGT